MRNVVSGILFVMGILFVALILAVLSVTATAEVCTKSTDNQEIKESTPAPAALKDAEIVVITARGERYEFSSNAYKIVPREVKRVVARERVTCTQAPKKNTFMIGGRQDYTDVHGYKVDSSTGVVDGKRGPVLDATYLRHNVTERGLGLGAGIDTNGTVRGIIGVDF